MYSLHFLRCIAYGEGRRMGLNASGRLVVVLEKENEDMGEERA